MTKKKRKIDMKDVRSSVAENMAEGTSKAYGKLGAGITKLLIMPPVNGADVLKKLNQHIVWVNKIPKMRATSPKTIEGGHDIIMEYGFKLKEKYEGHDDAKIANIWKNFMPTKDAVVNAIDLSKNPLKVELFKLPAVALNFLSDELQEIEDGDTIWDLDEGLPLIIKGNGSDGQKRRYLSAKWAKNPAKLLESGKIEDEDVIFDSIHDLSTLQDPVDKQQMAKVFAALKSQAAKVIGGSMEDDDDFEEEEDDEDEKPSKKSKSKKSKGKKPVDDDDDFDDDDDDDEKPAKKSKAKKSKKPVDDDDDDFEDDDDDDFEDDDDDDEVKPSKKSKKTASTKKSKKPVDDDDDDDFEDDDDDDDEKPAKKSKKSKLRKKGK